jgi:hypothetical protein
VLGRPTFSRLSIVFESRTVKRRDGAVESYEEVPRFLPDKQLLSARTSENNRPDAQDQE